MDSSTQHDRHHLWETSAQVHSSFLYGSLAMALNNTQTAHNIVARLDEANEDTLPIVLDKQTEHAIERWTGPTISWSPNHYETFLSQIMTDCVMNQLTIMRSATKDANFPTDELRDLLSSIATALIPLFTQAHAPNAVVAQLSPDLRTSPLNLIVLAMGAAFQSL